MLVRFLTGLVGGLLVGVVLFEALLAGLQFLTPEIDINASLALGRGLASLPTVALTGFWALAATASAAMAAALARLSLAGWVAGALWCVPALLIAGLGGLSDLATSGAIAACIAGTLAGSRTARMAMA